MKNNNGDVFTAEDTKTAILEGITMGKSLSSITHLNNIQEVYHSVSKKAVFTYKKSEIGDEWDIYFETNIVYTVSSPIRKVVDIIVDGMEVAYRKSSVEFFRQLVESISNSND